nr:putative ribonuclease H-like domain-containing protein [Tanacetum cinerariifolium]
MASEHSSSGLALHEMTPATISSGLVPNPPPLTPFVPPSISDWDILFQSLFDELLIPPPSIDHPAPEVITLIAEVVALEPAASTGSPSSTTVGISHETSVARSLQQNGVVERSICTLIEAASTMLIYAKALLFLWAEAIANACYTQNCSFIRLRHGKTPYELLHDKLPDLSFFHVFGALC